MQKMNLVGQKFKNKTIKPKKPHPSWVFKKPGFLPTLLCATQNLE
jgi:hypothetical protein